MNIIQQKNDPTNNPTDDFPVFGKLLNETFATVAKEFGQTKENSPTKVPRVHFILKSWPFILITGIPE